MLFVVHAIDKRDILPTRAKFYRAHRIHLDESAKHHVDVVTAGTLVATAHGPIAEDATNHAPFCTL